MIKINNRITPTTASVPQKPAVATKAVSSSMIKPNKAIIKQIANMIISRMIANVSMLLVIVELLIVSKPNDFIVRFCQTFLVAECAQHLKVWCRAFEYALNLALSGYVLNLTAAEVVV